MTWTPSFLLNPAPAAVRKLWHLGYFWGLAVLLSGCVSQAIAPPDVETPEASLSPLITNQGDTVFAAAENTPSDVTNDAIFQLLVAEFAGQRGRLDLAVRQYLAAAKSLQTADVAERAARIAVFARNYDAAIEAAKIWAAKSPTENDARQILAAMYIRTGNVDAAKSELEAILNSDSDQQATQLRMIVNLLGRERDKQTALAVMEKLLKTRTEHVEANVAYALLAIRAEQSEVAKAALTSVSRLGAMDANLAVAYISLLQKQERTAEAIGWLREHLRSNPDDGLRMVYARLLADAGQYDPARKQFEILAQKSPSNSDVIYALGLLSLQAERVVDAEQHFKKLVKLDVRKDDAKFYLGQIAESRGENQQAIALYQEVLKGQNYFMSQVRIALLLANDEKIPEARAQLNAIQPENEEQRKQILNTEAEILARNKQYDEAMKIYDAALVSGYDMELLYTRAMLAEQMGRIDILERDLREIIEREPDNSQALNALGYTLADRTDRYEEALGLIERALEITPNDFYILDSMGWVMYRLGRFDEAVKYLEQARQIRDDPEVAAHLGEVLLVMGNKDEARALLKNAIQMTPDDKRLLEVIKKLEQ